MAALQKAKRFFSRIGSRNLVILTAVLLIGAAVYLNYLWFYQPTGDLGYGSNNMVDNMGSGDASTDATPETDYFAAAALAREEARDEAMEVLQEVVSSSAEGSEERAAALESISRIAVTMETEANIETLVLAKGFTDCVAVLDEDSASIIVGAEAALTPAQNAQICTVVYEMAGILPQNVSIISR
jgi:stage III sporulation protein AH